MRLVGGCDCHEGVKVSLRGCADQVSPERKWSAQLRRSVFDQVLKRAALGGFFHAATYHTAAVNA
jgi:hypothetical protein